MKLINISHLRSVLDDDTFADRVFSRMLQQSQCVTCKIISRNTAMGVVTSSIRHIDIDEAIKTCNVALECGVRTRRTVDVLEEWKMLLISLLNIKELSVLHDGIIPGTSDTVTQVAVVTRASVNYIKNRELRNISKIKRREKFCKQFTKVWG